jgi:hypothetical protein
LFVLITRLQANDRRPKTLGGRRSLAESNYWNVKNGGMNAAAGGASPVTRNSREDRTTLFSKTLPGQFRDQGKSGPYSLKSPNGQTIYSDGDAVDSEVNLFNETCQSLITDLESGMVSKDHLLC